MLIAGILTSRDPLTGQLSLDPCYTSAVGTWGL